MGTLTNPAKTMKRAIRHASRDASRPILGCVHLDEHGEVVATDSYRLSVEHGVWDGGENIDVPFDLSYDLAHLKASVKSVEVEKDGNEFAVVKATLPDGSELKSYTPSGKYPKWKALVNDKYLSILQVKRSELLAKTRELVKAKAKVVKLEITDKHELVFGGELFERAWADGNPLVIGFDPKFVRDALNSIECDEISIRLLSPITPASFMPATTNDIEVIVMPVRLDEPKDKGKGKTAKPERKPEPEKVDNDRLARSLYRIALDRAASDPDGRVEGGNASSYDRNIVFEYERAGQLTHESHGDYTSWYRDGEFVTCIERRWSKRKIHLTYPELKPAQCKDDIVKMLNQADEIERAAKEKAGADVKATVNDMGDGVTAVVIEPKKEGTDMAENKRIEELEAALAELKAELKARNDELEQVWKENESLKRKPEPKPEPEPEVKAEHETVAEVSLSAMQEWCEGKGLIATQKREGACIWVEGDSKPYADELKELGFRFAKKRKSWYFTAA